MAVLHGVDNALYLGGTPTTFTNEACTESGGDTIAQITATTKRVWDLATEVSAVDAGGPISGAGFSAIDYLNGRITFASAADPEVTVSGKYIPLLAVAKLTNIEISIGKEKIDTSASGEPAGSAIAGREIFEGSFDILDDLTADHDPGGDTLNLATILENGTPLLIDICPGGGTRHARGWVMVEAKLKDASGVVGATFGFKVITRTATGGPLTRQTVTCSFE